MANGNKPFSFAVYNYTKSNFHNFNAVTLLQLGIKPITFLTTACCS